MEAILIVDANPERGDLVCRLLHENYVEARRCRSLFETMLAVDSAGCPAVVVAHCDLIDSSFSELAMLRHHRRIKLLLYCTEGQERPSYVARLPEQLAQILARINEGMADGGA